MFWYKTKDEKTKFWHAQRKTCRFWFESNHIRVLLKSHTSFTQTNYGFYSNHIRVWLKPFTWRFESNHMRVWFKPCIWGFYSNHIRVWLKPFTCRFESNHMRVLFKLSYEFDQFLYLLVFGSNFYYLECPKELRKTLHKTSVWYQIIFL